MFNNPTSQNIFNNWNHNKSSDFILNITKQEKIKTFVEIGVQTGNLSKILLNEIDDIYVYLVDITFLHCDMNSFKVYEKRFTFMNMNSESASRHFEDCSIDMIYIDADHSYESVFSDLRCWYRKIKIGGILSGHDYRHVDFPGVERAIDDFLKENKKEINISSYYNFWIKK